MKSLIDINVLFLPSFNRFKSNFQVNDLGFFRVKSNNEPEIGNLEFKLGTHQQILNFEGGYYKNPIKILTKDGESLDLISGKSLGEIETEIYRLYYDSNILPVTAYDIQKTPIYVGGLNLKSGIVSDYERYPNNFLNSTKYDVNGFSREEVEDILFKNKN